MGHPLCFARSLRRAGSVDQMMGGRSPVFSVSLLKLFSISIELLINSQVCRL
jgi:hypothetical protein